jgi:hypothetical protein
VIISPPSAAKTETTQSNVPCVEAIIRRISKDVRYSKLSANTNPVFIAFHKNLKLHILQLQIPSNPNPDSKPTSYAHTLSGSVNNNNNVSVIETLLLKFFLNFNSSINPLICLLTTVLNKINLP